MEDFSHEAENSIASNNERLAAKSSWGLPNLPPQENDKGLPGQDVSSFQDVSEMDSNSNLNGAKQGENPAAEVRAVGGFEQPVNN